MDLVYMWSNNYKNLKEIGLNFSSTFNVSFNNEDYSNSKNILRIETNDSFTNFFGSRISNITAIIGKNGVGKSNILDLLGLRRSQRKSHRFPVNIKYFFVYSLSDSSFLIEGNDISQLRDSISNYNTIDQSLYSDEFSIVIDCEGEKLLFRNFFQFSKGPSGQDISGTHVYSYRHHYPSEFLLETRNFILAGEPTIFLERYLYTNSNLSISKRYSTLLKLNSQPLGFVKNRGKREVIITPKLPFVDDQEMSLNILSWHEDSNLSTELKKNPKARYKLLFLYDFLYQLSYVFATISVGYRDIESKHTVASNERKLSKKIKNINLESSNYISYYLECIKQALFINNKIEEYSIDRLKVYEFIRDLVDAIYGLNQKYFSEDEITIPVEYESDMNVVKFLNLIDNFYISDHSPASFFNFFNVEFRPFSSGEESLLNLYSAFNDMLTLDVRPKDTAIILLDEPETHMHPEWSRLLINNLVTFLNQIETGYHNYQLIITTHSPFIMSDLPHDNIIALEQSADRIKQTDITSSFAANIHSLLYQDFFMNSTIGEFAKQKINHLISLIKSQSTLSNNEKKELHYLLGIIDDPLIKMKLTDLINKYEYKLEENKHFDSY